jgi:hypothetical protein
LVDFGDLVVTVNDDTEVVYLCDKDGLFDMVPISHFDPCNNPSDAWPIIVENTISLTRCFSSGNENWHADFIESIEESDDNENLFSCETSCSYYDKNPLRAAMICFLKMKDAENAN